MADEILAGRLTVDTSEFTRKITEAVNKANAQIAKVGKEKGSTSDATKAIKDQEVAVNKLITTLQRQMEVSKQAFQKAQVNEVTQAYKRLTTGVSEYNRAVKAHDTQGKQYWSNQIASAKQYLDGVKANINQLDVEETQRRKILDTITKSDTAYKNLMRSQSQSVQITQGLAQQWDKICGIIKIISGISLYKIFGEALSYAKEFNAAMTDISVITTGTRIDTEALGASYRKMANDLRVTSTEIAKANATIFRQGFQDPNQAAAITRGATKFGAVTGIGTNSAIQNMTAAIQNFYKEGEDIGQFVEHLGDVWSYMGDKVATTGSEISEAMSKTAASVNSVGVSMEQASAWAAIMLANTQQAGNVIGTQMNSLIARYAKVTSKGYAAVTSDDEGEALSFNDVSKALREVGIEMYDVASKSFLPMNEMMDQLADKWGSLDEAQKKYIATTLGGTRGMNYLLTLLDNYNDAVKLQEGIIDGIVNSKYEVWMQGVEAAQNNLTNSMENLYAYLSSDVLTGFYNGMAWVVDGFVSATNAIDGWNIKIVAFVAGLLTIVSAIAKIKIVWDAGKWLGLFTSGGSLSVILAAVAALTTLGGAIYKLFNSSVDVDKLQGQINDNQAQIDRWKNIVEEIEGLKDKTALTADEMERFYEIRASIVDGSPYLQEMYGKEGEKIKSLAEAYDIATQSLQSYVEEHSRMLAFEYAATKDDTLKKINEAYPSDNWTRGAIKRADWQTMDSWLKELSDKSTTIGFNDYDTALAVYNELVASVDEVTGTSLQPLYDQVVRAYGGFIDSVQQEVRSMWSDFLPSIISYMFDYDAAEALLGDQSFTETILDFLVNTKMTKSDYEEYGEAAIQEIAGLYSYVLSNGMSSDVLNSIENVGSQYGVESLFSNFVDEYYQLLWNASGETIKEPELQPQFAERIREGVSLSLMKAINNAFEAVGASGLTDAELNGAYAALVDTLLTFFKDPEKLSEFAEDYTIALPVNIEPLPVVEDEGSTTSGIEGAEESAKSYSEQVRAAINDTKELQQAIDALKTPEDGPLSTKLIEKLANAYPQLGAALKEYAEIVDTEDTEAIQAASETLSALLQNISTNAEGLSGLGQIETITAFMDKLASGDYNVNDIESIVNLLGLTTENLKEMSPEELMDALNKMLEEQIKDWGDLAEAMGLTLDRYKSFSDQVEDTIHPLTTAEKAIKKLNDNQQLNISEVDALVKLYPDLADELSSYGKNTKDTTKLIDELNKHVADDAMTEWVESVESAVKKIENAKTGTKDYTKAMVELSNAFDFQGLGNLENLDFVTANLDNIRAAANGSADAFRALQEAAWVNILGTSSVDFSNIENGIALVGDDAQRLGQLLVSLGYFDVETKTLTSTQDIISGMKGDFINGFTLTKDTVQLGGTYQILKPAASNPFASRGVGKTSSGSGGSGGGGGGKKGGGGSGGGGSSSIKVSDSTQTLLDEMTKVQDEMDNKLKLIDLKREFHDIRGEIQGVIAYTKLEGDTLREQNVVLESNVAKLKEQIDEKQSVIDKNKSSSTAYKQAAKDLEELNKAHKEYTEQLLENINRLEEITLEMEKLQEEARQTTISVQELIRDTLEGKRKYERDMLDGTVALEDEIVEIIKKRYEKEQEMTIEAAEARQEALRAEIDEIDELISAREKLLNKEKESEEIAELQAKIARISADPTRRKEMMELQSQLAEKQKQQAWDTYEEELQAQKDSLNKQIDNIDDYMDYVNEYYEDLFEHPKKLIAEMREIIKQSDSEIIEWLKANTEEWSDYTEAKMQQTEEDWQEMINTMRGVTETYQKEIEEIMSWTNEEIITWLKQNNVDFQTATKEQQDSFLYTWKQTLTDWRNAYKSVVAEVNATQYSTPSYSVGGGGGGGGSYGGGGGGGYYGGGSSVSTPTSSTSTYATPSANTSLFTAAAAPPKTYTGHATYYYIGGSGKKLTVERTATSTAGYADAIKKAKDDALAYAKQQALSSWQTYRKANAGEAKDWIKYNQAYLGITKNPPDTKYVWFGNAYKKGGIIDYTGPAWVDGSKGVPERILTGEQNALFETLVATLQEIKRVSVPGFNGGTDNAVGFAGRGLVIEQINIQTQNLDSDADFDYIAERVGESIMSGLQRTMPTGGIKTF